MEIKDTIELFTKGYVDEEGEINDDKIINIGFEDGSAFCEEICNDLKCDENGVLLLAERILLERYECDEVKDMAGFISDLSDEFGFEVHEDFELLSANDEVFEAYLEFFVAGFRNGVMERMVGCRKCNVL